MTITLTLLTALALDAWLGEPRRFHPLVGFGRWAQLIEQHYYADSYRSGCFALLTATIPIIGSIVYIAHITHIDDWPWPWLLDAVLLYLAIGWNSLCTHARNIGNALLPGDLPAARGQVGLIVSRDTSQLDQTGIAAAAVESVLENGNDAIFGALFWFAIAGAPGAVTYRLANTLDAMWGYRNDRYRYFGWAAARLDDVLNYLPARLTALSYTICGNARNALTCWQTQGRTWQSPNAGPVMAAGAGSLCLTLGGPARYHGKMEQRPLLGAGRAPDAGDIERALQLIRNALFVWLIAIGAGEAYVTCAP